MVGKIKEKFITISERFTSTTKSNDGLFISESFDATSHFENETETVLRIKVPPLTALILENPSGIPPKPKIG